MEVADHVLELAGPVGDDEGLELVQDLAGRDIVVGQGQPQVGQFVVVGQDEADPAGQQLADRAVETEASQDLVGVERDGLGRGHRRSARGQQVGRRREVGTSRGP